jgi:alkylhydroperoxidase/carboxymuconolactone decarboxylase family protein
MAAIRGSHPRPAVVTCPPMDPYYDPTDLERFPQVSEHAPELGAKFFEWYGAVFADGALSAREKSLIALGVAHAVQCPYCIEAYTKDALSKGCDVEQLTEVLHVASAIKGGAAMVHGVQMRKVADRLGM